MSYPRVRFERRWRKRRPPNAEVVAEANRRFRQLMEPVVDRRSAAAGAEVEERMDTLLETQRRKKGQA